MSSVCRSQIFPIPCPTVFPSRNCPKKGKPSVKIRPIDLTLYLVTERTYATDEDNFLYKAQQAIKGGVTCIQLRDGNENLQSSIKTARLLKALISKSKIPLIINDRVDVALAVGADGVHLGQKDFPAAEARMLLGQRAIIGLTVETLEDVHSAENLDVDYLGVQVFPSKKTKPNSNAIWGLKGLKKIKEISRHRIVAIGGINFENLALVSSAIHLNKKQDGVAMVGALWRADNPFIEARKIRMFLEKNSPASQLKIPAKL